MAILLLILKIIGIIFLSLLGIVLLVLFYLLILPLTYCVFGAYTSGSPEGYVCFYDSLRLVNFKMTVDKDGRHTKVKLLWGLIGSEDEEETKTDDSVDGIDNEDLSDELTTDDTVFDITDETADTNDGADFETIEESKSIESSEAIETTDDAMNNDTDTDEIDDVYSADDVDKLHEFPSADSEEEDIKEESSVSKFKNIIDDESNQRAVKFLIDKIIKLLSKIWPHIKSADVDYSLGAPDLTGRLTGAIAMFSFAHSKNINISPDFTSDDIYAFGHLHLVGRIQLIFPVVYAISVIANKDCRRLYKQIKN